MKKISLVLFATLIIGCGKYEKKTICGTLKAKQEKKSPIGVNGGFSTDYYWMLNDGTMQEVDLEHFMKYEIGDSVCVDKWFKIKTPVTNP